MEVKIKLTPSELIQLESLISEIPGDLGKVLTKAKIKIKQSLRAFRRRQARSSGKETENQIRRGYYGRAFRGKNERRKRRRADLGDC